MTAVVRILWLSPDTAMVAEPSRALSRRGWIVDTASTVQEAMALARNRAYHFAIVDLVLPDGMGTDGWSQLKQLQPDLKGIMTPGSVALRAAIQAIEPGILAYLIKPLAMDDVCGLSATACEYQMLADSAPQQGDVSSDIEEALGTSSS